MSFCILHRFGIGSANDIRIFLTFFSKKLWLITGVFCVLPFSHEYLHISTVINIFIEEFTVYKEGESGIPTR